MECKSAASVARDVPGRGRQTSFRVQPGRLHEFAANRAGVAEVGPLKSRNTLANQCGTSLLEPGEYSSAQDVPGTQAAFPSLPESLLALQKRVGAECRAIMVRCVRRGRREPRQRQTPILPPGLYPSLCSEARCTMSAPSPMPCARRSCMSGEQTPDRCTVMIPFHLPLQQQRAPAPSCIQVAKYDNQFRLH